MKLDKSFLTLFVGLAMAACSNDEEMATGGQDLLPVDGREAYMSVVVDMPKSTGTRAPGENHGTADEQNVNEVLPFPCAFVTFFQFVGAQKKVSAIACSVLAELKR